MQTLGSIQTEVTKASFLRYVLPILHQTANEVLNKIHFIASSKVD